MSTTASDTYSSKFGSVKKLDAQNYRTWQIDLQAILQATNSWEIVNGNENPPPAGASLAARTALTDYTKRSALAITAIRFSCTDQIRIYIDGLTTPRDM